MLELKEKEGEFSRLMFCGDPIEISADVICVIHEVYNELRNEIFIFRCRRIRCRVCLLQPPRRRVG